MATASQGVGHFQPRAGILSRAKGHSVAGKAAYNARTRIENERTGKVYSFGHLDNPVLGTYFYPAAHSPEWAKTREGYWNGVELRENQTNSQLAMDWIIDLPHQMQPNHDHARKALQDFIRENFTRKGYSADLAFHPAHDYGDERNFHAHLMVGIRRFEKDGTWAKVKDGVPKPGELAELRERMADTLNRHLEKNGYDIRVDHRSNAERGIDREATIHLGKHAAALERRGVKTEPGDLNREIEERNAERVRVRTVVQDITPEEVETVLDRLRREDEERRRQGNQPTGEVFRAVRRLFMTMGVELGKVINIDPAELNRPGATYRRDVDEEQRRAKTQAAQDAETRRVLESIVRAEREEAERAAVIDPEEEEQLRQHWAEARAADERRHLQEQLAAHRTGLEAQLVKEGYVFAPRNEKSRAGGRTEAQEIEERRRVQEQLAAYRAGLEAALEVEGYGTPRGRRAQPMAEDRERGGHQAAGDAAVRTPKDQPVPQAPPTNAAERDHSGDRNATPDRSRSWMGQTGGYEKLSDALKALASNSYAKWAGKNPEKAKNLTLAGYVAYTQAQEQKRAAERETARETLRREAAERGETPKPERKPHAAKRREGKLNFRRGRRREDEDYTA